MHNKEKNTGKIFDLSTLLKLAVFVKPYQYRFALLIVLTVTVGVLAPLRPYLIQHVIDGEIAQHDFPGLTQMAILLVAIALVQGIIQFAHTMLAGWLGQQIIHDIRVKLYDHILGLQLKFFDNTPIGRLVTRTVSDIETLSEVFTNGVAAMVGDVLQLIFIFAIMFYTDWQLTLICLSTLPLMLVATYVFKEKIKSAFQDVRNAVSNLNTFVQEHITGMSIVQIFNAEKRERAKFEAINKEHLKANLRTVMYYSVYFPVAEVIGAAGTGLLVWHGAKGVIDSHVTLGTLIAFIIYISMFFRPIRMIADRFNTLQVGVVSADRVLKLLYSQDFIQQKGTLKSDTIEGQISFKNVWFAYKEDEYVLKDISFEVKPGENIAFVGATGAGKSSIINLITRFYEINKGSIELDGHQVKEYNLKFLRQSVGVVLQDVFLFAGNIRENITLGNDEISDARIWEVAELVGAAEFIRKLPGELDHEVMERGSTLSVGQRQLISFIRALVYDPKVIILDEATSSVDSETESMIQEAIAKLMAGRTAIVIAHRLATIQNSDKIIVLEKGEVVERGSHDELLKKDGHYANLHKMQYAATA